MAEFSEAFGIMAKIFSHLLGSWRSFGAVILFCGVELAIMFALSSIRKKLYKSRRLAWLRWVFVLVRWGVLTPVWFAATFGAMHTMGMSLSNASMLAIAGFAVYVFCCIEYYDYYEAREC